MWRTRSSGPPPPGLLAHIRRIEHADAVDDRDAHGPGVWVPPPLIFVGVFLLAWWIGGRVRPLPFASAGAAKAVAALGAILVTTGVILAGWGMVSFARAHTAIATVRPASQLLQHGPYRFTR